MRTLLYLFAALTFSLGFGQLTFAVCVQTGNTPEGGNIIDCPPPIQTEFLGPDSNPATTDLGDEINIPEGGGISVNNDVPIILGDGDDLLVINGTVISGAAQGIFDNGGNDRIMINGGNLSAVNQPVSTRDGDDTIIMNAGVLRSEISTGIDGGLDNDTVEINGGLIDVDDDAIELGQGNDKLTVNGGTLKSFEDPTITGGPGNDEVILNGGVYMPTIPVSLDLGEDNDSIKFGNDIELNGSIDCGEGDDTLIFAMGVPLNRIAQTTEAIDNLTAPNGSIVINGIRYTYENCEEFVAELRQPDSLPIPTLSEWGLIAMAGLIGIAGVIAVRKRLVV